MPIRAYSRIFQITFKHKPGRYCDKRRLLRSTKSAAVAEESVDKISLLVSFASRTTAKCDPTAKRLVQSTNVHKLPSESSDLADAIVS
jgi:AraC-like DNA-binding protein